MAINNRFSVGRKYSEEHYPEWLGQMTSEDEGFNLISQKTGETGEKKGKEGVFGL